MLRRAQVVSDRRTVYHSSFCVLASLVKQTVLSRSRAHVFVNLQQPLCIMRRNPREGWPEFNVEHFYNGLSVNNNSLIII